MAEIQITSLESLAHLASKILQKHPHLLALSGPLGAGKTTLTQALGKLLGVRETITSPTFGLQHIYATHHPQYDTLIHVDCYRLQNMEAELPALDLEYWLQQPRTLVVVEWAERMQKILTAADAAWVTFSHVRDDERTVRLTNFPRGR